MTQTKLARRLRSVEVEGVTHGATLDDVAHVTAFIKDNSQREELNAEWLKCFPDPHDRPARHTLVTDLQGGTLLQLEIIAVVQGG